MFIVNRTSKTPIYKQLYGYLRGEVLSGRLKGGTRLMSTREFAIKHNISRSTVENAYGQLAVEGYIESRERSGYVVMRIKTDPFYSDIPLPRPQPEKEAAKKTYRYDFHFANLDGDLFPASLWRKYTAEALLMFEKNLINSYSGNQGDEKLRSYITQYLKETRGVNCKPDQLILTSGTQLAIDTVCKLFAPVERTVAVEEPGYDAVRNIFESHSFTIYPVDVEEKGISIDKLRMVKTKLIYVIPSHQFPTGAVMPVRERQLLLEYAVENDAYIIEDDYDNELRYNSGPIQSLQSLDKEGRVIYIGTFSKTLSPGLRLAYMVLPDTLLERYSAHFSRHYCTIAWLTQHVLRLYIENGHWKTHLRVVYTAGKKKHDAMIESLERYMGDNVTIYGHNAGLHLMLGVKDGRDQQELISLAEAHGIKVYPTVNYWHRKENALRNTVMLGFASISVQDINDGIKKLAQVWFPN